MEKLDFNNLTDEQKKLFQSVWEEQESDNENDDTFSQEEFLKYLKEKRAEIEREQEALQYLQKMLL